MRFAPALLALPLLSGCLSSPSEDHSPYETAVEIVVLEHASAEEIVRLLSEVHAEDPNSGDPHRSMQPKFAADARTNSVVIRGMRREIAAAKELVASLDREIE
ncbi:MAG: secretin N-terminal domain-containing protein [Planctomycetota bacterium]